MAVSTNSITNDTTTTTTTTATAKKNIKMEPMLFEELFSTIGADVPSSHLVPSTSGANSVDAQTMLDEWLANDLQQTGMFTEVTEVAEAPPLFSSPSVDGTPETSFLGDSPLLPMAGDFELAAQPLFDSPLLGDISPMLSSPSSFTSPPNDVFANSPVLDSDPAVGNFFPDLHPTPTSQSSKSKAESPTPTAALVAQLAAAGAFNIPWGTEPAAQQVPLHPVDPLQQAAAIAAAQAAAAEFRLAQAKAAANPSNSHPAGIQYPSKRKTVDLEEIDPNDEVALKRAKNTDAARRSRMKKLLKMEGLERRVAEVEGENSKLVLRVAVLESEKVGGEAREHEYERRIKRLEEQLREAHKAMLDSRSSKE